MSHGDGVLSNRTTGKKTVKQSATGILLDNETAEK
jgi:hypothetical protein